jgi:hypothetical protein
MMKMIYFIARNSRAFMKLMNDVLLEAHIDILKVNCCCVEVSYQKSKLIKLDAYIKVVDVQFFCRKGYYWWCGKESDSYFTKAYYILISDPRQIIMQGCKIFITHHISILTLEPLNCWSLIHPMVLHFIRFNEHYVYEYIVLFFYL